MMMLMLRRKVGMKMTRAACKKAGRRVRMRVKRRKMDEAALVFEAFEQEQRGVLIDWLRICSFQHLCAHGGAKTAPMAADILIATATATATASVNVVSVSGQVRVEDAVERSMPEMFQQQQQKEQLCRC